ncbi:unnamed protein product [Amoebophrya sp. A25]|nr:unnamed protein product [Amoebophrya sp. A25]|eukprot:GSA25T00019065001.1
MGILQTALFDHMDHHTGCYDTAPSLVHSGTILGTRGGRGSLTGSSSFITTSTTDTANFQGINHYLPPQPLPTTIQLEGHTSFASTSTLSSASSRGPTSFFMRHAAPPVLPAQPDDDIWNAASELKHTYGYREIKRKINVVSSYAATACLAAMGLGYVASLLMPTEPARKKRKRPE